MIPACARDGGGTKTRADGEVVHRCGRYVAAHGPGVVLTDLDGSLGMAANWRCYAVAGVSCRLPDGERHDFSVVRPGRVWRFWHLGCPLSSRKRRITP
jgi:hypothetical protein